MIPPLATFSEESIYLDTMIPYGLLRGLDPAIKTFFQALEAGNFQAFTSVLAFDELAYRLLLALIKDKYPGSPLDQLRQNETQRLAEFGSAVATQLDHLRHFPNLVLLPVDSGDLVQMSKALTQYHLRPRDGLHLAAMHKVACFNLASNDHHFDQVPYIRRFSL